MHVECRLGLLAGERVTAAAGSGSGDVLSGGIDAGRVDELTAGVSIPGGGSVRGGGSRGRMTKVMEPFGETIASREIGLTWGSSGLTGGSSESEQGSSSELDGESSSELVEVWSDESQLEWSELETESESEGDGNSKSGLT